MTAHWSIALATTNRGKLAEYRLLLADLPVELVSYGSLFPGKPQAPEDGATLEENATIKARAAAGDAVMVTIAEDSGLEVDALGGRPGVRSARFAREGATDAENNAALLAALNEIDDHQRTARFRCVIALLDPWSDEPMVVAEGRCEGTIARQARGTGGFGYDPLFLVDGYERTMAELTEAEKNLVSHRARAVSALRPRLDALIQSRLTSAALLGG